MKKISKAEFLAYAEKNGLIFLGAAGVSLARAAEVCEQNKHKDFHGADRDTCTIKGSTIYREVGKGVSRLDLGKYDTVYRCYQFTMVRTFIPAGDGDNFNSESVVIYH